MFAQTFRMDVGANTLIPAMIGEGAPALLAPVRYAINFTITRGQALGIKTADLLAYAFNATASDGTQVFAGFAQHSGATDANGIFYLTAAGTSPAINYYTTGLEYDNMYTSGIFNPNDLFTAPNTGTATKEVDTITAAGSIAAGDLYSIILPNGDTVEYEAQATPTATTVATGLGAAWALNPVANALAAVSGTATLILTAKTAGEALNLAVSVNGVGTIALVITTPAVAATSTEVDTFTYSTATAADVINLTITYPNLTTYVLSTIVGSAPSVTTASAQVIANWNSNPITAQYAVATGTTTIILTAVNKASTMNVGGAVVGTGSISKVVTTAAWGRNLNDIINGGRPNSYVQQPNGWWHIT